VGVVSNQYHDCDVNVPHGIDYHDKVVAALAEDPHQHFIIREGVVYLVDADDLLRELSDETL
jgi:hypothetical protein